MIKKYVRCSFAFVATFLMAVVIFSLSNRLLFGEYIFMRNDLFEQYAAFIKMFWNQLLNEHSLFYSFNIGMGVSTIPLYSFYSCFNPINIVFLFVNDVNIASFILFALKISIASFAFQMFQDRLLMASKDFSVIFSVLYGLNGFVISNYFNIIWLDGVYCLPIIIIALDYLAKKNKMSPLIISYVYLFITNFYAGFIVGFFSFVVFVVFYWVDSSNKAKLTFRYLYSVFTAILLSAILLFPTAISILASKLSDDRNFAEYSFDLLCLIKNILPGASVDDFNDAPYIYCGILTFLLMVIFFGSKKLNLSMKLKVAIIGLLLVICCVWKPAYMFMHCFDVPNHFNYRFAYLICFYVISVAAYCANTCFSDWLGNRRVLLLLFEGYIIIELVIGSAYSIKSMGVVDREKCFVYNEFKEENESCMACTKDGSLYRVYAPNAMSINDAAIYGYNSIGYFSTVEDRTLRETLSQLGYATTDASIFDFGSTPVTRMLFGQKYVFNMSNMYHGYIDESVLVNDMSLPIAYCVSNDILDVDIKSDNPFDNLNNIVSGMVGENISVFIPSNDSYMELDNVYYVQVEDKFYFDSTDLSDISLIKFACNDINIQYFYISQDESAIYGDSPLIICDDKETSVNMAKSDIYLTHIVDVTDELYETKKISIAMGLTTARQCMFNDVYLYVIDEDALQCVYEILVKDSYEVKKITSSNLDFLYSSDVPKRIFMSIPYDEGWKVTIDGYDANICPLISETFISFDVPEGKHQIKMLYRPKGFTCGTCLFAVGVFLFCIQLYIDNIKRTQTMKK